MKLFPSPGSLEPLEARIAPATLIQAGQGGSVRGEIDYTDATSAQEDAIFVNTEDDPTDPISALVGPGVVGVADTFYAILKPGTILKIFNNTGFQPLISGDVSGAKGTVGTIVAFFVDKEIRDPADPSVIIRARDNEVQADELTGLALGNKVRAIISGGVDGDVVTNFNAAFDRLGGADEAPASGTNLLKNKIAKVTISGDVTGSVVSGGQIGRLVIGGAVTQVLAGSAANEYTYDFNTKGLLDGGDTLAVAAPGAGVKGVSILNTTLGTLGQKPDGDDLTTEMLVGVLRAGDGGPGAAGGTLKKITIQADTDGFTLAAGAGGAGAGSRDGGSGGKVLSVFISGPDAGTIDATPNSPIQILGGAGAEATGPGGKGGAGGQVKSVFVGFEKISGASAPVRSVTAFDDPVRVEAGAGGDGTIGGKGGAANKVSIFSEPSGAGNDIQVIAGNGGDTNATGKSGTGGAIKKVFVLNSSVDAAASDSTILLQAGDAGLTTGGGNGANGGAIKKATLFGFAHDIRAGDGASGRSGGNGGTVKSVRIDQGPEGVVPERVLIDGGAAGVGTSRGGGNGGSVASIRINNSDLISLDINQTALAGDGAASKSGRGGNGGSVKNIVVTELDQAAPRLFDQAVLRPGSANISGGSGGAGGDSGRGGDGGAGGKVSGVRIQNAVQLGLALDGGDGGVGMVNGKGGAGGALTTISFFSFKQEGGDEVTATAEAGAGGNGAGRGAGAKGGDVKRVNIALGQAQEKLVDGLPSTEVDGGALTLTGGAGGNGGPQGGAGKGGAISTVALITFGGSVSLIGGDAGTGVKSGAGGKITGAALDAGVSVSVLAGDGMAGGAGGKIANLTFSRSIEETPLFGTVTAAEAGGSLLGPATIVAGAGSGGGGKAGKGGSITNLTGFVGFEGLTEIRAGDGGATANKTAAGGSVKLVNLFGGGGAGAELRIEAGDGGSGASAKVGGKGGQVRGVGIGVNTFIPVAPGGEPNLNNAFAIAPETIVRHIAAGNGGDTGLAGGRGGAGGDVVKLDARYDIGVRSGEGFGFTTMGGIFAGAGGLNTTVTHSATELSARDGKAGNVRNVTADAISTIAAGRIGAGDIITIRNLATIVDGILLNEDENASRTDNTGVYTNFEFASIIGGVVDPQQPGAAYPAPHPHANTFDETADPGTTEFIDNDNDDEFSLGDTITAQTDGLVAAIKFINSLRNVRPEALLTIRGGDPVFIDLNNLNGQAAALQP